MAEFKVEGMTCQGCVRSVTAILAKGLSVDKGEVQVDLEAKRATFPKAPAEKLDELLAKLARQVFEATLVSSS